MSEKIKPGTFKEDVSVDGFEKDDSYGIAQYAQKDDEKEKRARTLESNAIGVTKGEGAPGPVLS